MCSFLNRGNVSYAIELFVANHLLENIESFDLTHLERHDVDQMILVLPNKLHPEIDLLAIDNLF